jgi:glycosyltransferase involved in cell wall biosynthesis
MKLSIVTGEFPPDQGGVGDYARELAAEFARRSVEVQVITKMAASRSIFIRSNVPGDSIGQPQPGCTPDAGARVNEAPARVASGPSYTVSHARFRSWRSLPAVRELVRGCDIVHLQYQAAAYGMTAPIHLLPRFLRGSDPRRPVVLTFHDLRVPYLFPKAGPLRGRAIMYLARSCNAVVVTNQADLQTLNAEFRHLSAGARPELVLIPIGSNIDAHAPASMDREQARASLGVAADELLMCYFGFLNASKGGETLVRVLAHVVRAGCKARLLMLGGEVGTSDATNASYAGHVKALISELGLDRLVIWTGYRPPSEVTAFWSASDIAVLPYVDGASLRRGTLMAALAHALPVVTTAPRLPIPQFHAGENIALAPAEDVEALANQVMALYESPLLRERLSRGAAQAAQEFTWPRIVDRHLELYRSLLARGG